MSKARKQSKQGYVGVMDFVELPMKSVPEWAIIALDCDFATAAAAVKSVCRPKQVWTSPEVRIERPFKGGTGENISLSALIGAPDQGWTILVRSVGFLTLELSYTVQEEARELSERLQSRAVMFSAEDTSDCIAYEVYDKGALLEMAEWSPADFVCFGSDSRQKPDLRGREVEFADDLFREYGIYVPACYLGGDLKQPTLQISARSGPCVASVWLFDIRDRRTPPFPKLLAMRREKLASLKHH